MLEKCENAALSLGFGVPSTLVGDFSTDDGDARDDA